MSEACKNCNAALKYGPDDYFCRARPPQVIVVTGRTMVSPQVQTQLTTQFPIMKAAGWCRQWQCNTCHQRPCKCSGAN